MIEGRKFARGGIELHTEADFAGMRAAGRLAAEVLDVITPMMVPGTSTEEIDQAVHDYITKHGAIPATLGYKGYPKSCCTSVNHVVCHGIPGPKKLVDGDIINVDVTPILDGWYGDTSRMYSIGTPSVKARRLIDTTYESLMAAIAVVKPGVRLSEIGRTIQEVADRERFGVVRDFCGHGLGRVFHTQPSILHYDDPFAPGNDTILQAGMIFTIEPMLNAGTWETKTLNDGWTAITRDRSLSAQFEHSIGITEDGCEIFTLSPAGYTKPPFNNG